MVYCYRSIYFNDLRVFPKAWRYFSAIPNAVLGGAIITVFGMILINGIKMIAKAGFSERNILVIALPLHSVLV